MLVTLWGGRVNMVLLNTGLTVLPLFLPHLFTNVTLRSKQT